ncbi:iron complex transport system ATP-binding protein [Altererythrobacter atlanticus]|uniref:Hemin import ATP-binding protein HmuV n=1 Tax=Croceibacterium atlanticum TaxID=1267766 RepID=A0A0F7KYF1_9SPHN|nr:ABC transporter ATP-binding protein [Croceibacterium atlanticum]AKH43845.1 Hemin import ATP-binding protein HmuV [Croceibacterium atlanticum]MBB5733705.1 iron complex transport system ATP-binding protein [Croceibacterium atlanticum]
MRLEAHDLAISLGGKAVVSDASLMLEGGMFLCLLGPNGAGKSTLMAALAGLRRPDAGSVLLDRVPITAIDRRKLARLRAYLPQNPRAEWPISVKRLVALGLTPQLPAFGGLPPAMRNHVARLIEQFDLQDHRNQPATTLSGGELARAMLARALVGDPDILLVDEPLAGLDPRHALESIARLRAQADSGRLVIAALQELTLAARFSTHIAVMREGRIMANGPTAEVLTSRLLHDTFDIDACVNAAGTPAATVDFVPRKRGC